MAKIVNLHRARKSKARADKAVAADANRVKHGVAKIVRDGAKKIADLQKERTDAHRLDRDEI
jgi:hypothetical protein